MAGENEIRPKGFKAKMENYWYYHKFSTIVVFVLVFALAVSITQCSTKTEYDYQLVLAVGSVEMAPSQIEALTKQVESLGEDQNGDGKVEVNLIDCTYNEVKSSYSVVMAKRQKIQSIMVNEQEILLFICDKACFEWLSSVREEGFMEDLNLSEEDGRYFSLSETKLYEEAKAETNELLEWPKDMRISRRIVKGTLIEKDEEIVEYIEKADNLLSNIIAENS